MVHLFFMILKIFSCRKRVLDMNAFNSSSSYHLLLARGMMHGMLSSISSCTLEDLHGGESMKYGSMVYMYGWVMEEHQPIGIDYQPI